MEDIAVNNEGLLGLFSRVCLGGLIEDCLLEVKGGVGRIQAIDETNCLFLVSESDMLDMPDMQIGQI